MTRRMFPQIVFLTVVLSLVFAASSMGFNRMTRKSLLADAVEFSPKQIKTYLEAHPEAVYEGMVFDYNSQAQVDPRAIAGVYDKLVLRLKAGEMEDVKTIRAFGVLAGMISQAIYPGYRNSTEDIDPEVVVHDGFHNIGSPGPKVKALMDTYSPYWRDNRHRVQSSMYGIAVNEIVDFWTSAWKEAGKDTGKVTPYGEEIQRDALILTLGGKPDEDPESADKDSATKAKGSTASSSASIPSGWIQREKRRLKNDLARYEEYLEEAEKENKPNRYYYRNKVASLKQDIKDLRADPQGYYKKSPYK